MLKKVELKDFFYRYVSKPDNQTLRKVGNWLNGGYMICTHLQKERQKISKQKVVKSLFS
jgi:hypothetical protein